MSTNFDPLVSRGVEEIITKKDLLEKLKSKKILRIKLGVDPTTPDLHIGHGVCFHKLREFQELGHKIVFLIGDFTARIGDPSGRLKSREFLSKKQVEKNMQNYLAQAGKIIDLKKVEVKHNSEWFDKGKAQLIMDLTLTQTVARVIEREDFKERMKKGYDIALQELIYPIMQGYDSVMVKADVEVGGTDQKFNMLMGRDIQKKYHQNPQIVITLPLLIGLDGQRKMSKSYNNYIAINEEPFSMYCKVMSIADELIVHYFELAARTSGKELTKIKREAKNAQKCRNLKATLAREIVTLFHGVGQAAVAEEEFNRVFKYHQLPMNLPEILLKKTSSDKIYNFLVKFKLCSSKSEARRLITQNGVKIDQSIIDDPEAEISLHSGMIFKVGKRKFAKIIIE